MAEILRLKPQNDITTQSRTGEGWGEGEKILMGEVSISKDQFGRLVARFLYDPIFFSKVKTIEGHRWHPAEKHCSFRSTYGMMEKILKVFM